MELISIFCPECGEEAEDVAPENYIGPGAAEYRHVSDGTLQVVPLRPDGLPEMDDAAAIDLDHAASAGTDIDSIAEQLAG